MARDDNVHSVVQTSDDLGEAAGQSRSAIVLTSVGAPTLVDQDDDGLDALFPQAGDKGVHRLRFVLKGHPLHGRLGHYGRGAFEGQSDERDAYTLIVSYGVGREDRVAGGVVNDVGSEELELSASEWVAVQIALDGMGAAALHPPELREALVELMVAHAVEVEPHKVHGLDGRFVVKESGNERRPSDEVARGDEHGVFDLGPRGGDVGSEEIGPPDPAEGI